MLLFFLLICCCIIICFCLYIYLDQNNDDATEVECTNSLVYDELTREVILNDCLVVSSFRSNSLNCELFEYLNQHKERKVTYDELAPIFSGREVVLTKIADQMGFKGELKKALFTLSKDSITYHPSHLSQYKKLRI